jgi:hypothetical protein
LVDIFAWIQRCQEPAMMRIREYHHPILKHCDHILQQNGRPLLMQIKLAAFSTGARGRWSLAARSGRARGAKILQSPQLYRKLQNVRISVRIATLTSSRRTCDEERKG